MTRLLVTGAGGMTGWELAQRSSLKGFDCLALDRNGLDITDAAAVMSAFEQSRPDVVINAAAYTAVDKAESERALAMRINGDAAGILSRASAEHGAAIVHISTDYVFDGSATTPYLPDHPPHPLGAYGESKLAGEEAVRAGSRRHAIVRTSWVFSDRGRNFVRTMAERASSGQRSSVVNDQYGRPTAAGDLADALLVVAQALCADPGMSGTWHFANVGVTTWYDFARAIFEMRGSHVEAVQAVASRDYPAPARRPSYSVLDTSSFEQTFGVIPRHWRDALGETLEKIN